MTYASSVAAPVLVIAGENDPRCPLEGIMPWVEAVRAHGVDVDLQIYPEGHHANAVDERLGLRVEAIALVPLGTAVHRHHGGERSMTRRGHHERVDSVAAGIGEEEGSERSTGWWAPTSAGPSPSETCCSRRPAPHRGPGTAGPSGG